MSQWKKVKIGDFLTERGGRFKPDDKAIAKYQRLDKIDFSGTIHISNKPTKTDMILVQPGDLVISGINVAKGAIAVYRGEEPVCATIHYSSYTFDDNQVDLDYFKFFVKSPAFVSTLQKQVKGGIKTEIKAKHFLALEISIPDLLEQKRIVTNISEKMENIQQLSEEEEKQKAYAKQLRANILQDAIEGKLTADWREKHPVKKGNPDFDAEALFEKILDERKSPQKRNSRQCVILSEARSAESKDPKTATTLNQDSVPFAIPKTWKWVKLSDITLSTMAGKSFACEERAVANEEWGIVKTSAITSGVFLESENKFYKKNLPSDISTKINRDDFLFCRASGSKGLAGRSCVVDEIKSNLLLSDKSIRVKLHQSINVYLVNMLNNSQYGEKYRLSLGTNKSTSMNNLTRDQILNLPLPLPPLAEQNEIITRVEKHLETITQLENQIATRETLTKQLMQGLLKDAFEEK